MDKKIRVLIAKPGLDGHDRGALIIAQSLRDAGMEVIYTGLRQTPEKIVSAAIQEDVDIIGLSSLSGAHKDLFPKVVELLEKNRANDIIVIGGGVIPWEDIPFLKSKGIKQIFTPGTSTSEIANFIKHAVLEKDNGLNTNSEIVHHIDHIGIAVRSLDHTLPFYINQLNLELESIETVKSEEVRVAFIRARNLRFELLEPTSGESPIAKFIEKRGEGLHHVGLGVTEIQQRINELQEKGISFINTVPKQGASGANIAFIHPKSGLGVLYELCEKPIKETT